MRGSRSSPSMWATFTVTPSLVAMSRTCSAQPAGLRPAGVRDDLDAPVGARAEDLLHLGQERVGVAAVGVAGLGLPQDQHRQLGEPVTGEDVDRAALDHLPWPPRCGRRRSRSSWRSGRGGRSRSRSPPSAAAAWPVSTCSPGATCTAATVPSAGASDLVLHLHRLDDDERLAGRDGVAGGDEHAQHVARHRRDERAGGERGVRVRVAGQHGERDVAVVGVDEALVAVPGRRRNGGAARRRRARPRRASPTTTVTPIGRAVDGDVAVRGRAGT